jgi:Terminase large subunit, T4likevirus-type, N-terminal
MYKLSEQIERKFVDVVSLDEEWEIETDTGYKPLTHINKTVEYDIWELRTEDGLELDCADDHIVFRPNHEEVFVKNLCPGDIILTKNGLSKVKLVSRTAVSENMFDVTVGDDNHRFYSNGILSHNTAAMAAYILWFAIFQPTKMVAVLANKMDQAQEIMDRIRMAFEYLPFFLQHGVKVYNKRRVEFDNGSVIFSAATSSSGIRGRSVDLCYIDEAAFVENDLTFYESTYPVQTPGLS